MTFKQELHRAMSQYHVGYEALAFIMGFRWKHWLSGPCWNRYSGWFDGYKGDPNWAYPETRERQLQILELIKKAQDNPEYWRFKYDNVKSNLKLYAKGIVRLQHEVKKAHSDHYAETLWQHFWNRTLWPFRMRVLWPISSRWNTLMYHLYRKRKCNREHAAMYAAINRDPPL
jgi:hypothetical protein